MNFKLEILGNFKLEILGSLGEGLAGVVLQTLGGVADFLKANRQVHKRRQIRSFNHDPFQYQHSRFAWYKAHGPWQEGISKAVFH